MTESATMFLHRVQPRFPQRAHQRGAVLLVALIFLILLTLLAIGASSGSLLQQRMVAATRSAQLAVMSGNTALRGAEWKLWTVPGLCNGAGASIAPSTGCVLYDPSAAPYAANGTVTQFRTGNNAWLSLAGPITYTGANGAGYTSASDAPGIGSPNVAANPQYIIEDMGAATVGGSQHESGGTGFNGYTKGINIHVYRITARATGGTKSTVRVVESTFDAQAIP